MSLGSIIVGYGALVVTAEIAAWCFRNAAEHERKSRSDWIARERKNRRDAVRRERGERRAIEREAQRRLRQEEYEQRQAWLDMLGGCHDEVWDMRHRSSSLRHKLKEYVRANQQLIKSSPLTFQQREAIRDCSYRLQHGVERLRAYTGPYLQIFVSEISAAKQSAHQGELIEPSLPHAALPDDFPVVGDNLALSHKEASQLESTGMLDLGYGQVGRLERESVSTDRGQLSHVFIDRYDSEDGGWKLSAAKGTIAAAVASEAPRTIEATILSHAHKKGGVHAVWHSPFGESLETFMPYSLAEPCMRAAPWGTRVQVFVHQTDYLLRRIIVGQQRPPSPDDQGDCVLIDATSGDVRRTVESGLGVSPSTLWLVEDGGIRVRIATGEEFAVNCDEQRRVLRIGPLTGRRLGIVEGPICRSGVELRFHDEAGDRQLPEPLSPSEFLGRVNQRLEEQTELQRAFKEETLETRKYQLVLEAKLEARKSSSVVLAYSGYSVLGGQDEGRGSLEVDFEIEGTPQQDLDGYGLKVLPHSADGAAASRLCGYVRSIDLTRRKMKCWFTDEQARTFVDGTLDRRGKLQCAWVDSDTSRQVRALEQFRSMSALQSRSVEDRQAARTLRRVLLGLEGADTRRGGTRAIVGTEANLNDEQRRAVELIDSENPLTLVLGPPGTGKTDTVAIALERLLRRMPGARVAVVSQANVAVDEALNKLMARFPECDVVRHVGAFAADTVMPASRDVTQQAHLEAFMSKLAFQPVVPEWAAGIRKLFQLACHDKQFVDKRIIPAIVQSCAVHGCTLSRLERVARGAPLFDLIVVDEAAKASLPECMIAALSAKRLVLVGDHNQLLPFVDEAILEQAGPHHADRRAVQELWNNSLFKRMWEQAHDSTKVFLSTQYRSRSGVRNAVSDLFYKGRLAAGRSDESPKVPFSSSLVWVDTKCGQEDQVRSRDSLINRREVDVVLATLEMLSRSLPSPSATSVAIICFYGAQREQIERAVSESPQAQGFRSCEVRTVDASQGGQWDVVLLALTRCHGSSLFVGNANRLNVALSRARELAVVVGSFGYALRDRRKDSRLGDLARYMEARKGREVWICAPGPRGGIAPEFGSTAKWRRNRGT